MNWIVAAVILAALGAAFGETGAQAITGGEAKPFVGAVSGAVAGVVVMGLVFLVNLAMR